jgi:hypothetical protein
MHRQAQTACCMHAMSQPQSRVQQRGVAANQSTRVARIGFGMLPPGRAASHHRCLRRMQQAMASAIPHQVLLRSTLSSARKSACLLESQLHCRISPVHTRRPLSRQGPGLNPHLRWDLCAVAVCAARRILGGLERGGEKARTTKQTDRQTNQTDRIGRHLDETGARGSAEPAESGPRSEAGRSGLDQSVAHSPGANRARGWLTAPAARRTTTMPAPASPPESAPSAAAAAAWRALAGSARLSRRRRARRRAGSC